VWNAFTHLDFTAYFQVMPAHRIDIALELEADRMTNSIYDAEEVESERTVILSERDGNENEPIFRLTSAVQSAAFGSHPYRYDVIGEKEDLLRISRDDLFNHYNQFYTPDNALVAVAGDFDSQDMLRRLRSLYEGIPAGNLPHQAIQPEPALGGEKRVEVSGSGTTTYMQVAYRSPAASNHDFFLLNIIDSLLTGPSSLSMFGGGGLSNRTSRLYRALVDGEFAVAVNGSLQATIDPNLYTLLLVLHPGATPEQALAAVDQQVEMLWCEPVPVEIIERAVKQAKALFAYSSESITNQAFWLGYAKMFADYEWFLNFIDSIESVSPDQIQAAAQRYLTPANRVVGVFKPTGNGAS
jgi:zinc protease